MWEVKIEISPFSPWTRVDSYGNFVGWWSHVTRCELYRKISIGLLLVQNLHDFFSFKFKYQREIL